MSFEQSIYDKRNEFYKKFANEFFHKDFWKKVKEQDLQDCCFLCQFYKVIKFRCDTDDNETSKIAFDSMKKKCLGSLKYEKFKEELDLNLSKHTGFKSRFGERRDNMNNFHALYLDWELKMLNDGYIEAN